MRVSGALRLALPLLLALAPALLLRPMTAALLELHWSGDPRALAALLLSLAASAASGLLSGLLLDATLLRSRWGPLLAPLLAALAMLTALALELRALPPPPRGLGGALKTPASPAPPWR
jgi:hypothetical protein